MGGGTWVNPKIKQQKNAALKVYNALSSHPNFKMPPVPENLTIDEVVNFTLEVVARYISPKKVAKEQFSYTCLSLANSIKKNLKNDILLKLKELK